MEETERGFVDPSTREGNTSLTSFDQPTSLTEACNHRCHYWFPFIPLFSFSRKNWIFNSSPSPAPHCPCSISLFRLFAILTHDHAAENNRSQTSLWFQFDRSWMYWVWPLKFYYERYDDGWNWDWFARGLEIKRYRNVGKWGLRSERLEDLVEIPKLRHWKI